MNPLRRLIGRAGRAAAPRTLENLDYVQRAREHDPDPFGELRAELTRVTVRLDDLERRLTLVEDAPLAIDEIRADSLRIAELTDLVMTTLRPTPRV